MKSLAFIFAFILFLILLTSYESPFFISFDENMALLLGGNKFFGFFHYFGETSLIIVISLILIIGLGKIRNQRGMLLVILTVAVGYGLNQMVKKWVARLRPEITDQLTSFSFPSGHAMLGLLYLFTLAYLLSEVLKDNNRKLILWIGAIVLSILIGLSRIAEERHFGTDVLAGWFLGYTWFTLCIFWYEGKYRINKRKRAI